MSLPRIAITMGDPAGVGPELSLQVSQLASVREICVPVIFGDAGILTRVADRLSLELPRVVAVEGWESYLAELVEPTSATESHACVFAQPVILDLPSIETSLHATGGAVDQNAGGNVGQNAGRMVDQVKPGVVDAVTGRASYRFVDWAIQCAMSGEVAGIVTGPLHKMALHAAGVPYPGHTEMLADKTNAARICMMLTSEEITCSLVTAHVGLHEVAELLTSARILEAIELSHDALCRMRGRDVNLVVCGLNPHAGEDGLFGNREEETIIEPAIAMARARGISVRGPLPPDTAFTATIRAETDGYICMYHDQGLIPLKALAFDTAVNVTLGLPIIRTSVDHGTALDIAWQGTARVTSFEQAVKLAVQLMP